MMTGAGFLQLPCCMETGLEHAAYNNLGLHAHLLPVLLSLS
jgi:hypothetical protein